MRNRDRKWSAVTRSLMTLALLPLLLNNVAAQCPPLGNFTGMSGDFNACPGMSLTYTVNSVTNATSYKWYLPPGATISGMNPYTTTSTTVTINYGPLFSAPGNICVEAMNGCSTKGPYCKALTPAGNPSGASSISGSINACPGQTQTYSVANQANRTFDWTVPANAIIISGQGTNVVSVQFNAGFSGGNICVRVGNGCAYSAYRCMLLYASKPATPLAITGPLELCGGQTGTYSTGSGGNAPVDSYNWTIPMGSSIVGQGTSTVQITMPLSYNYGDIYVVATNGCGSGGQRSLRVRSTPAVPLPISGLAAGICNGTTSYNVVPDITAISYNWTLTGAGSITSGQGTSTINVNYPPSFVSGKICVTVTNACATSGPRCLYTSKNVEISSQPQDVIACNNTDMFMTVGATGMNLHYQWRKNGSPLSNGGKITGADADTLKITGADSLDAAAYDVVVSTTCGSQITSNTANLTIKQVPVKPGVISGAQLVTCPGTTGIVYSVPLQADATGFLWGGSDGVVILSGQGTDAITLQFDSTINSGYSVYVFGTNECGTGTDSSTSWTRYSISYPVISGQSRVCDKLSGVTYSTQVIAGANTYDWTMPSGATLVSGQGTNSIVVDFGPTFNGGDIIVTASNVCFTTPEKKLTTVIDVPGVPGSLTGSSYGACNTQLSYNAGNSNYATSYTWTLPPNSSIISGAGTANVTIDYLNPGVGAKALCVAGTNYCRTGNTRCINVKATPDRPAAIIANPGVFCKGQTGVQFSTAGGFGASSYTWTVPAGSVITSGQGTTSIVANMGSNNGITGVTGANACGSSGTRTFNVTMNCREAAESASTENSPALSLYPNPAVGTVTLSFTATSSADYKINVFDLLGKKRMTQSGVSKSGVNEQLLNIQKFSKGIYIVELVSTDYSGRIRLEVR